MRDELRKKGGTTRCIQKFKANLFCHNLTHAVIESFIYPLRHSVVHKLDVPGVYEIPVAIKKNIKKYDAFVALGCVIKGETPHFDLICSSVFNSILSISTNYGKPIGNGIITALNNNQAKIRSATNNKNKTNKGSEAANAVIMILKNEPKKI